MDGIGAFVNSLQPWHWWSLGAILIALEIATTTFYLLWPGIAALLVGVIVYFYPGLGGNGAVGLFALLAVLSTLAWKRSRWGHVQASHTLNAGRGLSYRGRKVIALDNFTAHGGAVLVDDTRWAAIAVDGSAPRKGETLEVVDADGTTLKIKGIS